MCRRFLIVSAFIISVVTACTSPVLGEDLTYITYSYEGEDWFKIFTPSDWKMFPAEDARILLMGAEDETEGLTFVMAPENMEKSVFLQSMRDDMTGSSGVPFAETVEISIMSGQTLYLEMMHLKKDGQDFVQFLGSLPLSGNRYAIMGGAFPEEGKGELGPGVKKALQSIKVF